MRFTVPPWKKLRLALDSPLLRRGKASHYRPETYLFHGLLDGVHPGCELRSDSFANFDVLKKDVAPSYERL
jgi:hypothetical protein